MCNKCKERRQFKIDLATAPLPEKVDAVSVETDSGNYIVCLNSEKPSDNQTAGFLHEMLHIFHDDFNSPEPVANIEADRQAELLRVIKILEQEAMHA